MPINLIFGLPVDNLKYLDFFYIYQDGVGPFRFVFVFQELDVWRFRFMRAFGSVRFVSQLFNICSVSFPFHRRFVTSVSLLDEK